MARMHTTTTTTTMETELVRALVARDEPAVRRALEAGADASTFVSEESGQSCLMLAAHNGMVDAVVALLRAGAPWNALDRRGMCAGDYAIAANHQTIVDELVSAGVSSELVFGALTSSTMASAPRTSLEYLQGKAVYEGNVLKDSANDAVMMEWERPLMAMHAQVLCGPGARGRVLNVGYGMGIIDACLQTYLPVQHTIIEAHADVLAEMKRRGVDQIAGVVIVPGRWQDVIHGLGPFDGVFFDTFGEHLDDLREFHRALPRLLAPGGVYSFFNGMCPNSFFFQAVACEVVRLELLQLGLIVEFHAVDVDAGGDETWANVARRYFSSNCYYLPVATWARAEDIDPAKHRRNLKRVADDE